MQHSPSSITLANRCDRAWWHCYRDKLRPPELTWKQVKRMKARFQPLPAGAYSKALGKEVHRLAEFYCHLPPAESAKRIDWNDLPGKCLAELVPYLPPAGSVNRRDVERRISVEVNGVRFRGFIDLIGHALRRVVESYDHKTSGDIRAYALLPDAVARRLRQPKRSLLNDLQACVYTLARARKQTPASPGGLCRWNYTETKKSRRALPVVQYVPTAHALTVVEQAAVTAKRVEGFETIDDAVPNTLACDQYGGCWYRAEGHCTVRRKWGAVFIQLEREAKEQKDMGKMLTFKKLGLDTAKANAEEEAKAAKASKRKAPPPPVDAEESEDEEDEAPPSERKPAKRLAKKAKRKARHDEITDADDDDAEDSDDPPPASEPSPAPKAKPKSARAAEQAKFDAAVPADPFTAVDVARGNLMIAFGDFLHAVTRAAGARGK